YRGFLYCNRPNHCNARHPSSAGPIVRHSVDQPANDRQLFRKHSLICLFQNRATLAVWVEARSNQNKHDAELSVSALVLERSACAIPTRLERTHRLGFALGASL